MYSTVVKFFCKLHEYIEGSKFTVLTREAYCEIEMKSYFVTSGIINILSGVPSRLIRTGKILSLSGDREVR